MDSEKRHDIALMRYSAIAPLISGTRNMSSLVEFYRTVARDGVKAPDGQIRHYAASTIKHWHRAYLQGGFDRLLPTGRCDAGRSRKLDADLMEQIRYLKTAYPRMSASAIYRQLKDNGSIRLGQLSESTVNRYCKTLDLQMKTPEPQDMRRYERAHVNEVWYGDSSVGPRLTDQAGRKRKVYIVALIDDASRFITGIDVFFNDNFVNVMSVMKSAVAKYGRPKLFSFDNGSSYRNRQMELVIARIGASVNYCQPYTPTSKAKIERWFRTMKDQWMAGLDMREFRSLDALRGSLLAYVQRYRQTPHSSLNGMSPEDRYFSEPEQFHHLTTEAVHRGFLLEIKRRVSMDHVIVIEGHQFEVPCRFVKKHICLRYTPDMKEFFVVEANDSLTPIQLLNKQDNSQVKRDKVRISGGNE